MANSERARDKRAAAYREGEREFATIVAEPLLRDFVCLYLAEGYKRNRNRVSIANSDPAIVVLAAGCLRRFSRRKVTYWVQYHADQDLDELAAFWARQLGICADDVRFQRKSNSNQLSGRTWRSEHGVLTVLTDDTLFRARLQAWMDRLRESWV